MDEQEIRRVYEELLEAMQEQARQEKLLGASSIALNKSIADMKQKVSASGTSLGDLEKASKGAAEEIEKTAREQKEYKERLKQSTIAVGKNLQSLGGSLAKNDDSFGQLNGTITAVGDVFADLVSGIPLLGNTLSGATKALAGATNFVIERLDDTAKAYTQLGSVGATAGDGITGLVRQFDQLGSVSLPTFTQAIADNSTGLSAFGGTTAGGAEQLSRSLGELTNRSGPFGRELLRLGVSLDEAAEIGTQFTATQSLLGRRQFRTTRDVTTATFDYIKELDLLSRITGTSRKEAQAEQRKTLADARFRAKLESLRAQGNSDAADALERLVEQTGGPLADAIRASATGIPLTEEAARTNVLLQGGLLDVVKQIENGASASEALGFILERSASGAEQFRTLLQFAGDQLGAAAPQIQTFGAIQRRAAQEGISPLEAVKKAQEELAKGTDGTTDKFADAQLNIAAASREVQRLGFDFLPEATIAVNMFTTALSESVKKIREVIGKGGTTDDDPSMADLYRQEREKHRKAREEYRQQQSAAQSASQPAPTPQPTTQTATQPASAAPVMQQITADTLNQKLQDLVNIMGQSTVNQAQLTAAQQSMTSALGDYTASRPGESVQSVDDIMRNLKAARSQTQASGLGMSPENLKLVLGSGSLPTFATGGITAGPSLAGEAGPEAVVPLPDGRSIPIQMPDYSGTLSAEFSNSTGAMMDRFEKTTQQMMNSFKQDANSENKEQLARLDASVTNLQQLVTLMKDQNSATNKLLQVSRN